MKGVKSFLINQILFFLAEHLQVDCVRASPHLQVDHPASVKLQSGTGHLAGTQGPVIL